MQRLQSAAATMGTTDARKDRRGVGVDEIVPPCGMDSIAAI
jgi:hypothetical protein